MPACRHQIGALVTRRDTRSARAPSGSKRYSSQGLSSLAIFLFAPQSRLVPAVLNAELQIHDKGRVLTRKRYSESLRAYVKTCRIYLRTVVVVVTHSLSGVLSLTVSARKRHDYVLTGREVRQAAAVEDGDHRASSEENAVVSAGTPSN